MVDNHLPSVYLCWKHNAEPDDPLVQSSKAVLILDNMLLKLYLFFCSVASGDRQESVRNLMDGRAKN